MLCKSGAFPSSFRRQSIPLDGEIARAVRVRLSINPSSQLRSRFPVQGRDGDWSADCSTALFIMSVAMFVTVGAKSCSWAVGSYRIGPPGEGISQNIIFKTLRQTG